MIAIAANHKTPVGEGKESTIWLAKQLQKMGLTIEKTIDKQGRPHDIGHTHADGKSPEHYSFTVSGTPEQLAKLKAQLKGRTKEGVDENKAVAKWAEKLASSPKPLREL